MTKINDGGPAFPHERGTYSTGLAKAPATGMTIRDYFAGQALAGLLADSNVTGRTDLVAQIAYSIADAMLAERARNKGGQP